MRETSLRLKWQYEFLLGAGTRMDCCPSRFKADPEHDDKPRFTQLLFCYAGNVSGLRSRAVQYDAALLAIVYVSNRERYELPPLKFSAL